jgi:hypothetical protein
MNEHHQSTTIAHHVSDGLATIQDIGRGMWTSLAFQDHLLKIDDD